MRARRNRNVPPEDASLFRDTVGPVRPVRTRRVAEQPPPPKPRARFTRMDEAAVLEDSLSGAGGPEYLETGEELSFRRPGISARVLAELRRGRYAVQDELDLHGLSARDAKAALLEFMGVALGRHLRCIRIIHGKGLRSGPGGPVLKGKLNRWLPQWEAVLAFTSAPPRDGGTGALYVLISPPRRRNAR